MLLRTYWHLFLLMKPSPPSFSRRGSWAFSCSAASWCRRGPISLQRLLSRWQRCSQLFGFFRRTAGCRRPPVMRLSIANSISRIGWREIFNPSFPYRLAHTVVAFFTTTGFVVMAAGAYLIRRDRCVEEGRVMLSMTLWLLTVLVPLQMIIGDSHGLNTRDHQPAKLAAIE